MSGLSELTSQRTRPSGADDGAGPGARYLGAGRTFRLDPPRLRTNRESTEQRHATWFELFFDLVFLAAVNELAAALARDPAAIRFARFCALFVIVVWAWVLYTLYANRFDTDDLIFRLAKSGAMLAIAAVAVCLHRVMSGNGGAVGLALGYVALRVLLIALYVRAWRHVSGRGRRLTEIYIVGYTCTTGMWLASVWAPGRLRYELWALAMVVDLVVPTRAWATLKGQSISLRHLTERFGTFFIIVLGQAVAGAVAGLVGFDFTVRSAVAAGFCFVVALCVWWIYFDLADTSVVGRGALGLVYVYGHFSLLVGVTAFGVGTRLAVTEAAQPALDAGARWALAGGVGAFALSLAVVHIGAEWTSMRDRTVTGRLVLVAAALSLASIGRVLPPVAFVTVLASAVFAQLMVEALTPRAGAASVVEQAFKEGIREGLPRTPAGPGRR